MKVLAIIIIATLMSASFAFSDQHRPLFKYGTSCYGPYGQRNLGNISKAIIAVKEHFEQQGLRAKILSHSHRFIRADIYKGEKHVDSIIMDISTGKMRSVY